MSRIALSAGFVVLAVAGVLAQERRSVFEVASVRAQTAPLSLPPPPASSPRVRPGGRFSGTHATVFALVMFAYDLKDFRVTGAPEWVRRDYFDVNAQAGNPDASHDEIRLMVRSLLEDRFRLVVRRESREMEYLRLVLARPDGQAGPYLQRVDGECDREKAEAVRKKFPPQAATGGGVMQAQCVGIDRLALMIGGLFGIPVVDSTALEGQWVFEARFASLAPPGLLTPPSAPSADPGLPPFAVALEEQLGLRLESARGPIDVLIIDSVAPPTEN